MGALRHDSRVFWKEKKIAQLRFITDF